MADLIDRAALLAAGDATKMNVVFEDWNRLDWKTQQHILNFSRAFKRLVEYAPTVDAVEVEVLKAWLYEIAMNNTDNYLGDACEEIISRLEGLRVFARERRTDGSSNRC